MTVEDNEFQKEQITKEARTYGNILMDGIEISNSVHKPTQKQKPPESDRIIDRLDEDLKLERETITKIFRITLKNKVIECGKNEAKDYIKNNPKKFRIDCGVDEWFETEYEDKSEIHKYKQKSFDERTHKHINKIVIYELVRDWYNMGFNTQVRKFLGKRKNLTHK